MYAHCNNKQEHSANPPSRILPQRGIARKEIIMKALHEIAAFLKSYGEMFPEHMYIGK